MTMLTLFALGGLVGLAVAETAGTRAHRARFNTIAVAILGALLGGLLLPRLAGGAIGASPFRLLAAAGAAAIFSTGLAALRR